MQDNLIFPPLSFSYFLAFFTCFSGVLIPPSYSCVLSVLLWFGLECNLTGRNPLFTQNREVISIICWKMNFTFAFVFLEKRRKIVLNLLMRFFFALCVRSIRGIFIVNVTECIGWFVSEWIKWNWFWICYNVSDG